MRFIYNKTEYELILLTLSGSRLYGNSTPESDWDYRGIVIQNPDNKLGMLPYADHLKDGKTLNDILIKAGLITEESDDIEFYDINKFAKLAADNNPNIMDILNVPDYAVLHSTEAGRELLGTKDLFISSKIKFTFSGYAISQLKRIKGHKKWLTQYPDIHKVHKFVQKMYDDRAIDFNWICDNFSGQLAEKVTGETPQVNESFNADARLEWRTFCMLGLAHESEADPDRLVPRIDYNTYRRPQMIDYCIAYDLKHKKIDLGNVCMKYSMLAETDTSYRDFLTKFASFRCYGKSMLTVYTEGKGIFSKDGKVRANDPEHIGEFVCLLSMNPNQYKADTDEIEKLWNWKVKRNEKRATLEEKYGYDTKHASHLIRLLRQCKKILIDGFYDPRLVGDDLQEVKDIRAGKYDYEGILELASNLDDECSELYKTTELQKSCKIKEVNKLIIKLNMEYIHEQ